MRRGDWILVAPGDYHESADLTNPPASFEHGAFGGVLHHQVQSASYGA